MIVCIILYEATNCTHYYNKGHAKLERKAYIQKKINIHIYCIDIQIYRYTDISIYLVVDVVDEEKEEAGVSSSTHNASSQQPQLFHVCAPIVDGNYRRIDAVWLLGSRFVLADG